MTGIAWLFGRMWGRDEPVMPFLPNSDFQTGIVGCIAIMNALDKRNKKGGNYLVSTSLNQLNSFLISLGSQPLGIQQDLRERWPDMLQFRYYDDLHRQMRVVSINYTYPPKSSDANDLYFVAREFPTQSGARIVPGE